MKKEQHHWAKKKKIEKYQEEKHNFLKIAFCVFLVIFFCIVFYALFFSSFLKITNVSIEGVRDLEREKIQEEIERYLDERFVYVFGKNNLIVFGEAGIEEALKEKFKKIRSVSVSKEFPGSVTISIVEKDLLLLWCSREKCFMIDEEGRAYQEADLNSKKIKENDLIRVSDLSGKEIDEGGYVLEKGYCDFVLSLKDQIWNELRIAVSAEFETPSRIADEVIVATSEGWKIYFDSRKPLGGSIENLGIFLKKEADHNKRSNLEYVDLRAGNKIFYKLRGEDGENEREDEEVAEMDQETEGNDQSAESGEQESESVDALP